MKKRDSHSDGTKAVPIPGTRAGFPVYIPTSTENDTPVHTRLIERRDERYFDFLDRLSSIACTEGLTGLSLR